MTYLFGFNPGLGFGQLVNGWETRKEYEKEKQLKNKGMKYLVKQGKDYWTEPGTGSTPVIEEAHHWTEDEIHTNGLRKKTFLQIIPVGEEKPKQFYIRQIDSRKYWKARGCGLVRSKKEAHAYSEEQARGYLFSEGIGKVEIVPVGGKKTKKPNIYLVEVTVVGVIHLYVVGQSKQQVHDKVRESIGIMPIKISRISKYKGDATDFPFLTNTI